VHGEDEARRAVKVSEAAFSRDPIRDPEILDGLFAAIDNFEFTSEDLAGGALRLAISSGVFASNGEARRSIVQGGLSINDERMKAPEDAVPALSTAAIWSCGSQEEPQDRSVAGLGLVAPTQSGDHNRGRQLSFSEQDQGVVQQVRNFARERITRGFAAIGGGDRIVLGRHQDLGCFLGHLA